MFSYISFTSLEPSFTGGRKLSHIAHGSFASLGVKNMLLIISSCKKIIEMLCYQKVLILLNPINQGEVDDQL